MPKILLLSHSSPENVSKHWVNTLTLHGDPATVKCWPCHRLHNDISTCTPNATNNAAACMTDMTVELLLASVRAALGDRQAHNDLRTLYANRAILPSAAVIDIAEVRETGYLTSPGTDTAA